MLSPFHAAHLASTPSAAVDSDMMLPDQGQKKAEMGRGVVGKFSPKLFSALIFPILVKRHVEKKSDRYRKVLIFIRALIIISFVVAVLEDCRAQRPISPAFATLAVIAGTALLVLAGRSFYGSATFYCSAT
jgi:hypothetical protein